MCSLFVTYIQLELRYHYAESVNGYFEYVPLSELITFSNNHDVNANNVYYTYGIKTY